MVTSVPSKAVSADEDVCVHDMFRLQAEQQPDAIAVSCDDIALTYYELQRRAQRVAGVLQACGVGPETLVGLCHARDEGAVVAVMGILMAGAGYVPIDPADPQDRIAYIVRDSRISLVVSCVSLSRVVSPLSVQRVLLDDIDWAGDSRTLAVESRVTPDNAALVCYTSGSTGRPKGLVISHRSAAGRIKRGLPCRAIVLQKSPLSLAAHIADTLMPLALGLQIHIIRDEAVKDLLRLAQAIRVHNCRQILLVPSQIETILASDDRVTELLGGLDAVIVGGEQVRPDLARRFGNRLPETALIHAYGTSETAGSVIFADVTKAERAFLRNLLSGAEVHVLNGQLNPVPPGSIGELYVSAPGLARCYLNSPRLTAERFIANPFSSAGARVYRTGDLGKLAANGAMEVVGRMDHALKVRGYRVEPSEVEKALEQYAGVKRAVVVGKEDNAGSRIEAFIELNDGAASIDPDELRRHLSGKLPLHMIPSSLNIVREFPLLAGGKIDRRRLATQGGLPVEQNTINGITGRTVSPRTATETLVAQLFKDVLHATEANVRANFLHLGGDSLTGMLIIRRIEERCGVTLSLQDLLDSPTVEMISGLVDGGRSGNRNP
jgi:amino acid adenylation domain-containing protein